MARTADQIVTEQLGALHLQLVIAQARAEQAEEKVAELSAKNSVLQARLPDAVKEALKEVGTSETPEPEEMSEIPEIPEMPEPDKMPG